MSKFLGSLSGCVRRRAQRTGCLSGSPAPLFGADRVRLALFFDGTNNYVYKGARLVVIQQDEPRDLADWAPYPLCVANEADGVRPWLGKLWQLRVWASP